MGDFVNWRIHQTTNSLIHQVPKQKGPSPFSDDGPGLSRLPWVLPSSRSVVVPNDDANKPAVHADEPQSHGNATGRGTGWNQQHFHVITQAGAHGVKSNVFTRP